MKIRQREYHGFKKYLYAVPMLAVLSCGGGDQPTPYAIAYTSDGEIYLTDTDGQSKIQVTDREGNDGYPAWSPDGKRLASYAYHDGRKTWSIHTMNIDGTNRQRLTHAENKWDSAPAWSPDGSKIAFARAYADEGGNWREQIWTMNADGSEQTQLEALDGGAPHFLQDGRIAFHSQTQDSEISIADIDGSNIIRLTNNDAEDWHPEVSPDGKQIAFMSNRDGNHEIYIMNIDGSDQKRLTFNDVEDWYPSWSPDGSQVIFASIGMDDERYINIMNKDGSSVRKIIDNGSQPAWSKVRK